MREFNPEEKKTLRSFRKIIAKEKERWEDWENDFCSTATLKRYLLARDFDLGKAKEMLFETLRWRGEYRPWEISADEECIAEQGKMRLLYRSCASRDGRPVVVFKVGGFNYFGPDERFRYLIFLMEQLETELRASKTLSNVVWILDFSLMRNDPQGRRNEGGRDAEKRAMHVLQSHYPERLGAAFLVNTPFYFAFIWTIAKPFMNHVTRGKIHMVGNPQGLRDQECLDPDLMEQQYGGMCENQVGIEF